MIEDLENSHLSIFRAHHARLKLRLTIFNPLLGRFVRLAGLQVPLPLFLCAQLSETSFFEFVTSCGAKGFTFATRFEFRVEFQLQGVEIILPPQWPPCCTLPRAVVGAEQPFEQETDRIIVRLLGDL